jgi:preprotein translocase subunit SecE
MSTNVTHKKKVSFFREVINELKKVTWTTRPELMFSTKSVVLTIFIFGFGIYLCDLVIHGAIDGLGAIMRMILG